MNAACLTDVAGVRDVPSPVTVLVVEDSPEILDLVTRILKTDGYSVLRARSGFEALALAHAHYGPITLLLTDVSIGDLPGAEVARRLLTDRKAQKALFMSGAANRSATGDLGAVMPKPFTRASDDRSLLTACFMRRLSGYAPRVDRSRARRNTVPAPRGFGDDER